MARRVKKIGRARARPALAILSRKKTLYSTRRLLEAAKARGLRTRVLDVLRCNLTLEQDNPRLYHKGKEVRGIGVALPRIGASVTQVGLSVVRQLEAMGVPVVNGAAAIARSRDKLAALQQLAAAHVPIPRTVLARAGGEVRELVAQVGGLPAILKLLQGTQGVGVMIAHSEAEVESIVGTLRDLGQELLLQEFVAESRGRDIRALVVGDRVVGAMRREARRGEFRSNLHRGGFGTPLELPREYARRRGAFPTTWHRGGSAPPLERRREYARRRCAPRGSWAYRSPGWICLRGAMAPRCSSSIPAPVSRGWSVPPGWTSPARSSASRRSSPRGLAGRWPSDLASDRASSSCVGACMRGVGPAPHLLGKAVRTWLRGCLFDPGVQDGRRIAARVRQTLFEIR